MGVASYEQAARFKEGNFAPISVPFHGFTIRVVVKKSKTE